MINRKGTAFARSAAVCFLAFVVFFSTSSVAHAEELSAQAVPSGIRSCTEFSGANRYETASEVSQAAYPGGASSVIIASGVDFPDALAATALAGAKGCPILLTLMGGLPAETIAEIHRLGASNAYIIGGTSVISTSVEEQLRNELGLSIVRFPGANRFETASMVLDEVASDNQSNSTLIIAYGYGFADSLSIAPYAVSNGVPYIFTNQNGVLSSATEEWLVQNGPNGNGRFQQIIIVGGTSVVSQSTEQFCRDVGFDVPSRLGGSNRYLTSSMIADWYISQAGMNYSSVGLSSGLQFADALTGSVLQGQSNSILQLIRDEDSAIQLAQNSIFRGDAKRGSLTSIRFFGGTAAISQEVRNKVLNVRITNYDITLSGAIEIQDSRSSYTAEQIKAEMDPSLIDKNSLQFSILSKSGGLSADNLNSYLNSSVIINKPMSGMGSIFKHAAELAQINEVYLTAHAALETGWGISTLAMGQNYDGKTAIGGKLYPAGTYYNFFGIAAYDSSPLSSGLRCAVINGWNTKEKAIIGGAQWIADNYVYGYDNQDTLYKMRWNLIDPDHQYATDIAWARKIATIMNTFYSYSGGIAQYTAYINYDIPQYKVN